jgi:DNA mismatch repair protein MutH
MTTEQSPRSESELVARATALAGESVGEIAARFDRKTPRTLNKAKGWIGELIELALGATAHSKPVPDFEDLGIELKTIPLNSRLTPQESTFVSTVPMSGLVGLNWENCTVKAKLNRVLWVPVEAGKDIPVAKRRIGMPMIWSPSATDAEILRADWEEHIERIALGDIDQIDARFGTYLQVRPKAPNRRELTLTTDTSGTLVSSLPRGFYLRASFTRKILADRYSGC